VVLQVSQVFLEFQEIPEEMVYPVHVVLLAQKGSLGREEMISQIW
jgi:hypothetical protein